MKKSNINYKQLLAKSSYDLFKIEPYIGAIFQEIDMSFRSNIPTAGIYFDKKAKQFKIDINQDFFFKLKQKERVAVLHHEILHFLNLHLDRMGILGNTDKEQLTDIKIKNVAADMSINQYINNLPDFCIKYSDWKLKNGTIFPAFQTYEQYYNLIKDNMCANENRFKGSGESGETLDQHMWDEMSSEDKEAALKEIKGIFTRTIEKNGLYQDILEDRLKDVLEKVDTNIEKINAKKILSYAIKKHASSSDRTNSWKRPNKRLGNIAPGSVNTKVPRLNMYVDTSGSRSHTEINMDIEIIKKFLKFGNRNCILGLWHTQLYKTKKFKLADSLLNSDIESGGTVIDEVVSHINKTLPDFSIVLTDGCYDWNGVKPKSQVIFILVGNYVQTDHPMYKLFKTLQIKNLG